MSYLTHLECLKAFGDPTLERGMLLYDTPVELEIGVIPKRIYCNKTMVKPIEAAFRNLITTDFVSELKTWDGCFNIRKKRSGGTPSLHSWGVAVDLNAAWNRMGHPSSLSDGFVKCFTDVGFDWGGKFRTTDAMHFQLSKETFLSQLK